MACVVEGWWFISSGKMLTLKLLLVCHQCVNMVEMSKELCGSVKHFGHLAQSSAIYVQFPDHLRKSVCTLRLYLSPHIQQLKHFFLSLTHAGKSSSMLYSVCCPPAVWQIIMEPWIRLQQDSDSVSRKSVISCQLLLLSDSCLYF